MIATQSAHLDRADFLAALRRSELLAADEYDRAVAGLPRDARTAKQAAAHLVRGGRLTRFQADRLLAGKADGFHLGQYLILEPLGAGKVGRVYKARHRTMNRLVAVEVLAQAFSKSRAAREEFHKEARGAARLAHPNLVTVLDANEAGDRPYLVLEYVDGATLEAVVRSAGPLPVPQACEFARQAALGLAHAHEKGQPHGGLSPAAVLVGRPGGKGPAEKPTVKVLNVGLTRLALFAAETGNLHGAADAAEYLAPEQLADPTRADPPADLYALGCTLYYLLAGHPPRPAHPAADGPLLHQLGPAVPVEDVRPDVPPGVADLVARLMHPAPARRPASAAEVAAWLAPFAGAGSSADFALPAAAVVEPEEPSPFADLELDDSGEGTVVANRPRRPAAAMAGAVAVAAAIIVVTGMMIAVVLRSVAR
jgi:serine/threonine-protein kinase